MLHVLFVCSENRYRSPTAEKVFSGIDGVSVASAGTNDDALHPLTSDIVAWSDLVFVMEKIHFEIFRKRFAADALSKPVVCLFVPDIYSFMDPRLITRLEEQVRPFFELMLKKTPN